MENISDTALADSPHELQAAGIIVRYQYNEMPIRVEYSLSAKGQALIPVLDAISQWAIDHSDVHIYQGKHFDMAHLHNSRVRRYHAIIAFKNNL